MDDPSTIAALEHRIAELEAIVERIATPVPIPSAPPSPPDLGPSDTATPPADPKVDRRRLLGRAGTAAVGAVLGGTAATIAAASPAAAATGSFTQVEIRGSSAPGLLVTGDGVGPRPAFGIEVQASSIGVLSSGAMWGVHGAADGLDSVGVFGHGGLGYGLMATGARANILMKAPGDPYPPMPDPTTGSTAHQKGELYWSDDSVLWVCIADGTPGTWRRATGADTAGALTMLKVPTRVYDTRTGSGLPGAGTGPVTGVRHDIDLTANSSGLPTDATAALVTLTVTNTVANPNAYGQIYANALVTPPGTSAVNWTATNALVATTTTTGLTAGQVAISMNPGANVLIDVLGYYR